jgi:Multiubiquitin
MAESDSVSSRQSGISVIIDGATCFAPDRQLTGAQLRSLPEPPVGADRDLWQEVDGGLDRMIQPTDEIDLHAQMRFFTVPRVINPGSIR